MSIHPYPPQASIPPAGYTPNEQNVIRETSLPANEGRGWMQFVSTLKMISGILQCLTLIGILWGWIPIWQGSLLHQAASGAGTTIKHPTPE